MKCELGTQRFGDLTFSHQVIGFDSALLCFGEQASIYQPSQSVVYTQAHKYVPGKQVSNNKIPINTWG